MHHLRFAACVAAAVAFSTSTTTALRAAETQTGYYLANVPGVSVEYLALNDFDKGVTGYLEAIHAASEAPEGEVRTQIFVTRTGDTLEFGSYEASRTADGYVLRKIEMDGRITEERFVRTSAGAINASIVALSKSVSVSRVHVDRRAAAAELRTFHAMSVADSARMSKAQSAIVSAAAEQSQAQRAADRSSAIARQARAEANLEIEKPGVSEAMNQSRVDAMKRADDAEQNVVVAQRQADSAGAAVAMARAEVRSLSVHMSDVAKRVRALAANTVSQAVGATGR